MKRNSSANAPWTYSTEKNPSISIAVSPVKKCRKYYPMLTHVTRSNDEFLPLTKGSNWCRISFVQSTHIYHSELTGHYSVSWKKLCWRGKKSSQVLFDPTITEKTKQLTLLQTRNVRYYGRKSSKFMYIPNGRRSAGYCGESVFKIILNVEAQTTWKNRAKVENKMRCLGYRSYWDRFLTVDYRVTKIAIFFTTHSKQQHDPKPKRILDRSDMSPSRVASFNAKRVLRPTPSTTLVRPKIKTLGKASTKQHQVAVDSQAENISMRVS